MKETDLVESPAFAVDFTSYKFHPSSVGKIMTDSRTKDPLGETCKSHLMECYIKEVYGREKDISNKYIEKGLAVEEDSITLYSRVKKKFFKKNEELLENDFLVGTPDLFEGETIQTAHTIIDIKSSWDIFTFHNPMVKAMNKDYLYQLQGYMSLTGAKTSKLVYCLVNTPSTIANKEKSKLMWAMGATTDQDELFLAACDALDKEFNFDDIPIERRYIEFTIPRNEEIISAIGERVKLCREFLNNLPSYRIA